MGSLAVLVNYKHGVAVSKPTIADLNKTNMKNKHAQSLGKLGGLARSKKYTKEQVKEMLKPAHDARRLAWEKWRVEHPKTSGSLEVLPQ